MQFKNLSFVFLHSTSILHIFCRRIQLSNKRVRSIFPNSIRRDILQMRIVDAGGPCLDSALNRLATVKTFTP